MLTDLQIAKLKAWQAAKNTAKQWADHERRLRDEIIDDLVGAKPDGTYNFDGGGGYTIKTNLSSTVHVDAKKLPAIWQTIQTHAPELAQTAPNLFRWKPAVVSKEWKEAPDKLKALMVPAITTRPDAPTIEIIPPKAR